ncbi:MAG: type VI secretion system contractile sheath large subunit [Deltaproteobacteria bacterium]|nr:type VI secretion system contractile sheath large subunit [Deltaproteobacteria bacterium]
MRIPTIPFTVLALAPFCPGLEDISPSKSVAIDIFSMNEAVERLEPTIYVPVPRNFCPAGGLTLSFKGIKDFKPDRIIANNNYLRSIHDAGQFIAEAVRNGIPARDIAGRINTDWPDLPIETTIMDTGDPQQSARKSTSRVDDILSMVAVSASSQPTASKGATQWRVQCDELLSALLEHIFDNADFRTCEASWRGIELLVRQGKIKEGEGLFVQAVPVTGDGLAETLEELSTDLASNPPNLVLVDLPFDNTVRSINILDKVTTFAETLMVPTVCWITPGFFHMNTWDDLRRVPYLKHHLEDAAYAKWRKLRGLPGSHWTAITCNRFLTRFPYKQDNGKGTHSFREKEPLWLSPVWALGTLVCQSVSHYGWPCRFTDYMNINLTDLALTVSESDIPTSTEMTLSEDRITEFTEIGFTPLQSGKGTDSAFIPKEATLAGGSLKYQLFIAKVLGFLWWCRDNLDQEIRTGNIGTNLTTAFDLFWQNTGQPTPDDLEITAGTAEGDEAIPLTIRMTPPPSVLTGGHTLEMTFLW